MCKYRPGSQYLHISYKSFSISLEQMCPEPCSIQPFACFRVGNIYVSRVKKFKDFFA